MEPIKTYKGHEISLDTQTGKFTTVINGIYKNFASLQQTMNNIDKVAITDFVPVEVLIVDEQGYSPSTYTLKKVKLIGYSEEKSRHGLNRFYRVEGGETLRIEYDDIFALKDLKKLQANVAEANKQERIEHAAEKRCDVLSNQRNKMAIDLDPRPDMKGR